MTNHPQANHTPAYPTRAPYLMGIVTGAALALAAFTMMGQGYSRPADGKAPAGAAPSTPPAAPAMPIEVDEYFTTSGNGANTTARLWRRPAGKTTLEFLGEFQSSMRSNR